MKKIGFFYSCFKEKRAIDYSISQLRKFYPDSPIYLVSDGGIDFSYLESLYDNLETHLEEDTMSNTFAVTDINFREEKHQETIKKCVFAVLERLEKAINFCKSDWVVMMDPDTLIRGYLTIPDGAKLLGSRLGCCFPVGFQKILKDTEGAKVITNWGASPCVFEVKSFLEALSFFRSNIYLLDKFSNEFYAMYAHDVLMPTLFALIGKEETFNPDIIECLRDPLWKSKPNPLVHQFREYY